MVAASRRWFTATTTAPADAALGAWVLSSGAQIATTSAATATAAGNDMRSRLGIPRNTIDSRTRDQSSAAVRSICVMKGQSGMLAALLTVPPQPTFTRTLLSRRHRVQSCQQFVEPFRRGDTGSGQMVGALTA